MDAQPAWAAFVPIFQSVVMARVACVPELILVGCFLRHMTPVIVALLSSQVARSLGKMGAFQILTLSLPVILIWILAFEPRSTHFEAMMRE